MRRRDDQGAPRLFLAGDLAKRRLRGPELSIVALYRLLDDNFAAHGIALVEAAQQSHVLLDAVAQPAGALAGCLAVEAEQDAAARPVVEKPIKGDNGELRPAKTTFRKLAGQEEPRCTLVIATPHTGRPHQIRRHAQALSMPIIGDSAHGDSKVNRWWRQERGLDRLALHCLSIALPDPAETIVAPLEGSLADVLRAEPLWAEALEREPRLGLEPVDERSGSRG